MAECSAPYCHPRLNVVAATVNPGPKFGAEVVVPRGCQVSPSFLSSPSGGWGTQCVSSARRDLRRDRARRRHRSVPLTSAALAEKERALISRRTKDALSAAKARGIVIGGLRDKGRELQAEAFERAEALRPVFAELADMSANAMATSSTIAVCPRPRAAHGMRARLFGFGVGWERCREAHVMRRLRFCRRCPAPPSRKRQREDWNLITLCPRCYDKLLRNGVSNPSHRTRNARARGVRRPRLPAKSVMMPNWQATLLSLAVAVAFYAFAVRWRAEIILISTVALAWYGFAWLCQRHPMAAVFLVASCAGSWARGGDKPKALQVAATLVRELLGEG